MTFFQMRFIETDLARYLRALDRVWSTAHRQSGIVPYLNAVDYRNMVMQNILSQKFAAGYQPYHPRYAKWKTQVVLKGSKFWMLFADLLRNLNVFRAGKGWMGGIPANVYDQDGKSWYGKGDVGKPKPIAMYGRTIEFGLNNQPPRPVFGPTRDEYVQDGWKIRGREAQQKIKVAWR